MFSPDLSLNKVRPLRPLYISARLETFGAISCAVIRRSASTSNRSGFGLAIGYNLNLTL